LPKLTTLFEGLTMLIFDDKVPGFKLWELLRSLDLPKSGAVVVSMDFIRLHAECSRATLYRWLTSNTFFWEWKNVEVGHLWIRYKSPRQVRKAQEDGKPSRHSAMAIRAKAEALREGYKLLTEYTLSDHVLEFVCPNGHEHKSTWRRFQVGQRCGTCSGRYLSHEEVARQFSQFGYELLSHYTGSFAALTVKCPKDHQYETKWTYFQKGRRCPQCANINKGGYSQTEPGTVYYIRFDLPGKSIWKIGITNGTVKRRFSGEKTPYEIVWHQRFDDGKIPRKIELQTLRRYRAYQYKGAELQSGNTECFTIDVLGYDKPLAQLSLGLISV
jgi:hypothetical protein